MTDWTGVLRLDAENKKERPLQKMYISKGHLKSCARFIMIIPDKPVIIF